MKQVYPAFIVEHQKDFLVYIPDMDIYTEGKTMADAIEMARDAIGLKGIDFEDDKKEIPTPSSREDALSKAKANKDVFDYEVEIKDNSVCKYYSIGVLTLVDVNFTEYRKRMDNKAVRRNVTLPNWLNAEAEKSQINVSRVLQEALINVLGLTRKY